MPCGDRFLTCKFIKDSHKNKKKLNDQRVKVTTLRTNLKDLESAVSYLFSETDSLIMYPVWGSDGEQNGKMQVISHFLVEAETFNHQQLAIVNNPVYNNQSKCWQKKPTYAVA